MAKETQKIIMPMTRIAFPFIRQAYASLSADSSGAIFLPVFDTDNMYNAAIQFDQNPSANAKKTVKPKQQKISY